MKTTPFFTQTIWLLVRYVLRASIKEEEVVAEEAVEEAAATDEATAPAEE